MFSFLVLTVAGVQRNHRTLDATVPLELPLADLAVICELEDELMRIGHFTRIFPTLDTRHYHQFFENKAKYGSQ